MMKENVYAKLLGGQSKWPKSVCRGFPVLVVAEQLGWDQPPVYLHCKPPRKFLQNYLKALENDKKVAETEFDSWKKRTALDPSLCSASLEGILQSGLKLKTERWSHIGQRCQKTESGYVRVAGIWGVKSLERRESQRWLHRISRRILYIHLICIQIWVQSPVTYEADPWIELTPKSIQGYQWKAMAKRLKYVGRDLNSRPQQGRQSLEFESCQV